MTVREMMKRFKKTEANTRVYVEELDTEVRSISKYYDSEVVDVYDHNGDMVCAVEREV